MLEKLPHKFNNKILEMGQEATAGMLQLLNIHTKQHFDLLEGTPETPKLCIIYDW